MLAQTPLPSPPDAPVLPTPPAVAPTPSSPRTLDERKAQLRALFLQADRSLSTREIAAALGVNRDTPLAPLKALVAEGWLVTTDPNPRSPVLRYRRTSE
jgi:predicted ArsR family transcriptional regulator